MTQFNFILSDENGKYSHMIEKHVISRAVYRETRKQCVKHVVCAQGGTNKGRVREQSDRKNREKERNMLLFSSCRGSSLDRVWPCLDPTD